MLISEDYKAQNKSLHQSRPDYGTSGHKWARLVMDLCNKHGTYDVLDYGCGKGTLQRSVDIAIQQYDPCIEGLDDPPHPADIVACTDVLEHIEPECLDYVLDDIKRCTKKVAILIVATKPAKKILPDGRNAHICLMPTRDWLNKIQDRFTLQFFQEMGGEFIAIALP